METPSGTANDERESDRDPNLLPTPRTIRKMEDLSNKEKAYLKVVFAKMAHKLLPPGSPFPAIPENMFRRFMKRVFWGWNSNQTDVRPPTLPPTTMESTGLVVGVLSTDAPSRSKRRQSQVDQPPNPAPHSRRNSRNSNSQPPTYEQVLDLELEATPGSDINSALRASDRVCLCPHLSLGDREISYMYKDSQSKLLNWKNVTFIRSKAEAMRDACRHYDENEMERIITYNNKLAVAFSRKQIVHFATNGTSDYAIHDPTLTGLPFEPLVLCRDFIEESKRVLDVVAGGSVPALDIDDIVRY